MVPAALRRPPAVSRELHDACNYYHDLLSSRPDVNVHKPKLLFLSHTLPFPPDGGVNIRTYNILRLLSEEFDITALCFYRRATHPSPERLAAAIGRLQELADVEAFPIEQEYSRPRFALDHLRSIATGRPYTVPAYNSPQFKSRLAQIIATRAFDLVHVDSLDLSSHLPLLDGMSVVCVHHNVESALLARRARNESNPLLRHYVRYQACLMRAEERRWASRVALNVVVSEDDRRLYNSLHPGAPTAVVPNGVDTSSFTPGPDGTDGLVFVGGLDWYPNRDALEYFANEILPLVRHSLPGIRVRWIGRAPQAVRRDYLERYSIELTGYIDDIRPTVHDAACYIVPLRVGGGTRLKILDAWAMGKAVVSTSVGCEGLGGTDGVNILIRDEPQDFADAVVQVCNDSSQRRSLGTEARVVAEEIFDWKRVGTRQSGLYTQLRQGVVPRPDAKGTLPTG